MLTSTEARVGDLELRAVNNVILHAVLSLALPSEPKVPARSTMTVGKVVHVRPAARCGLWSFLCPSHQFTPHSSSEPAAPSSSSQKGSLWKVSSDSIREYTLRLPARRARGRSSGFLRLSSANWLGEMPHKHATWFSVNPTACTPSGRQISFL